MATLPTAGALALDGMAVTAGQEVTAADIVKLAFTPALHANGAGYASFTFRVSDGTDESASDYTMTVNVTAVNDPATGRPKISGTATVGEKLMAHTSGIEDIDGNTRAEADNAGYAYTYQWVRVGATETDIADATSKSYTLVEGDAKKRFKVKVWFTDDNGAGEGPLTSNEYPVSGTHGELRLADNDGATTSGQGRLEVFYRHEWGTVCDDRFDNSDFLIGTSQNGGTRTLVPNIAPQLACELMGYTDGGEVIPRGSMSIAPSKQPIWLDDVRCAEGPTHWRTGERPKGLQDCYHAGWGLNNCSHDQDVHLQCFGTPAQTATQETEQTPLTARFANLPDEHDGATTFTVEIVFSEAPAGINNEALREIVEVTGGTITRMRRVNLDRAHRIVTILPSGNEAINIVVPSNTNCEAQDALCSEAGGQLETGVIARVPGPTQTTPTTPGATALTARFANTPVEHDGQTTFTVEVLFSEAPADMDNAAFRAALDVTGGVMTKVRRVNLDRAHRIVTIRPQGWGAVDIVLPASPNCEAAGALCTEAGGALEIGLATRVKGPPGITVADAEVREG